MASPDPQTTTPNAAPTVPAAPEFGAPAGMNGPSAEMLAIMAQRRSASAVMLTAPAPDHHQISELIRLAARAPDHGKLFPWRFIVMAGQEKAKLAANLEPLAAHQPDPGKALATLGKLKTPPVMIAVISRTVESKIREWEQVLSAGAVCMNLLWAAEAMGFAANWITDWYSYDPGATALLALAENERVAGLIFLGSVCAKPLERVRPETDTLIDWRS